MEGGLVAAVLLRDATRARAVCKGPASFAVGGGWGVLAIERQGGEAGQAEVHVAVVPRYRREVERHVLAHGFAH